MKLIITKFIAFALLFITISLVIIGTVSVNKENDKRDAWFDSLNKVDAIVESIELSNVSDSKYYYIIEIKYTVNSNEYYETIIEKSTDKVFPYKVNDIYEIRIDDNNIICYLTDYEKNIAFVFCFVAFIPFLLFTLAAFAEVNRIRDLD
ncbi:MAG: hypothetical protein R3Y21_05690 [Mycoplasmatota bacterium]